MILLKYDAGNRRYEVKLNVGGLMCLDVQNINSSVFYEYANIDD